MAVVVVWGVFVRFVLDNDVMGLPESVAMSPPDQLGRTQKFSLEAQHPLQWPFPCCFALAHSSPQGWTSQRNETGGLVLKGQGVTPWTSQRPRNGG